jgi:hypothetical protein
MLNCDIDFFFVVHKNIIYPFNVLETSKKRFIRDKAVENVSRDAVKSVSEHV